MSKELPELYSLQEISDLYSVGLTYCICGCGGLLPITDEWGRERGYINGHNRKGTKHTIETRMRMSTSHRKY